MTMADEGSPQDLVLRILTSRLFLISGSILSLASIGTLCLGTLNRLSFGGDFQWSGCRLLLSRRDPWMIYLSGDKNHEFLLNQVPNYLHELYILLVPFGLLPFQAAKIAWTFTNFLLVCVICLCVGHLYELPKIKIWLLLVMVGMSVPFRESLLNGQVNGLSIVCIALWAFVYAQRSRGLLLGVSYTKYSFSPVLFIYLLFQRKWRLVFYSLIPPIAGFLILDAWLKTPSIKLALEPFITATRPGALSPSTGTIIALTEKAFANLSPFSFWRMYFPHIAGLLLGVIIAYYFSRRHAEIDDRVSLACLMTSSLICFPHLFYDQYLAVFCLGISLKSSSSIKRNLLFVTIAYIWYVAPILHTHLSIDGIGPDLLLFGAISAVIVLTCRTAQTTEWKTRWEI